MAKLRDKQRQIPNGFRFKDPAMGYDSMKVLGLHPSFDALVRSVYQNRQGNQWQAKQSGLALDAPAVAMEVEHYNAKICIENGWNKFVSSADISPPTPKPPALPKAEPLPEPVSAVAAGAETLIDWLSTAREAVPHGLAEHRAFICVDCKHNSNRNWTRFFTKPLSEAIRKAIEIKKGWKLKTHLDPDLNVCQKCLCPLKLKVHVEIDSIVKHLDPKIIPTLPDYCWIRRESNQNANTQK